MRIIYVLGKKLPNRVFVCVLLLVCKAIQVTPAVSTIGYGSIVIIDDAMTLVLLL
jgi:hypothetical protein